MSSAFLQAFEARLQAFEGATLGKLREAAVGVSFLIGEHLVIGGPYGNPTGTPVRTGYARAQWHTSLHDPVYTEQAADPGAATVLAGTQATLDVYALGDTIWFTNGASYIRLLEAGRSRQAPLGMVAPLLANAQLLVDDVVQTLQRAEA